MGDMNEQSLGHSLGIILIGAHEGPRKWVGGSPAVQTGREAFGTNRVCVSSRKGNKGKQPAPDWSQGQAWELVTVRARSPRTLCAYPSKSRGQSAFGCQTGTPARHHACAK